MLEAARIVARKRVDPERGGAEDQHRRREMDEATGVEYLIHRWSSRLDRKAVFALGAVRVDRHDVPVHSITTGSERRHQQHELLVVPPDRRRAFQSQSSGRRRW